MATVVANQLWCQPALSVYLPVCLFVCLLVRLSFAVTANSHTHTHNWCSVVHCVVHSSQFCCLLLLAEQLSKTVRLVAVVSGGKLLLLLYNNS